MNENGVEHQRVFHERNVASDLELVHEGTVCGCGPPSVVLTAGCPLPGFQTVPDGHTLVPVLATVPQIDKIPARNDTPENIRS